MAYSFKVLVNNGGARLGLVATGHGELSTPALLIHTSRGIPPNITIDNLERMRPEAAAVSVSTTHLMEHPSAQQIAPLTGPGGSHTFTGLKDYVMVASARDMLHFAISKTIVAANKGPHLFTPNGFRQVTPAKYMETISAMQPDIFATLPDELMAAGCNTKRIRMSVDRTLAWVSECLEVHGGEKKEDGQGGALLAAVVGGTDLRERARSAHLSSQLPGVAGFSLAGFGLGESPDDRQGLIEAATQHMPPEKIRHMAGLGHPEDVLDCVKMGLDIFDSVYPNELTNDGYAMTFPVELSSIDAAAAAAASASALSSDNESPESAHAIKMNLRSVAYRKDTRPLVEGCQCECCQHHSRAYIYHLLNTHEMLGQVLLDIHNLYHYLQYFKAIRESIREERFEEYSKCMMDYFQAARIAAYEDQC